MSRIPLRYYHWQYVWIPLVAAGVWFGSILAMLIVYLASGQPRYVSQQGNIAYISDVGASGLKPLFVTACCITAAGFFLSLVAERLLRHTGRLVPNLRTRERVLSILAIVGSFIGGCGLILLSILDTKRHTTAHRVCLLIFIVGIALSAIFSIVEGIIASILILLAIAFGITLRVAQDAGAIIEWIIAFGFTLYLLVFFYDLRMSKNVGRGQLRALAHPSQSTDMSEIS
ncbi:hypothetical protein CVT26_005581 [Gymnopilus dilepis]|uniref:CWH43-like N-terminal domain-containing protein n=1 Tax=Gymnopilus dilepis TaxID=231916 RepID=A0A409XZQ1_9AGAR|nr:hypothetical protein CVT26_005581 [Gymnopilus dilepis]